MDQATKSTLKQPLQKWRTDKPRLGRLVRIRYGNYGENGITETTARWWGTEGWQLAGAAGGYLSGAFEVSWLPVPGDDEWKSLVKLLFVGLWVDFRAIFKNAAKTIRELREELKA